MKLAGNFWLCSIVTAALLSGCSHTRQMVQQHNPITKGARDRAVRFDLAQVAEREGNLQRAADEYRTLLDKKPNDAQLCHRLGVVLIRQGEAEEGLRLLTKAADLRKHDRTILNDLGYALLETGDLQQAEQHFRAALAINPNDARTINNLGLCAGFAGRTEEAYAYFRRVGGEAEAQANLAYVLAQRGDVELATQHYNQALTHDPTLRPAAEALIQLTSLSRETAESTERIATSRTPTTAPAIRQASATIEPPSSQPEQEFAPPKFAPQNPAQADSATTFLAPHRTVAPTIGFSSPEETQFYRPVMNDAGR